MSVALKGVVSHIGKLYWMVQHPSKYDCYLLRPSYS